MTRVGSVRRKSPGVWTVPKGGRDGAGAPHRSHGSTLRFYDRAIGAWRSTWVEPVNGPVRKFVGREHGGEIELISLDGDPLFRSRFADIAPDRFTWLV